MKRLYILFPLLLVFIYNTSFAQEGISAKTEKKYEKLSYV